MSKVAPIQLQRAWLERWPEALGLWSRFTRLSDPRLCHSATAARREGLSQSFAMIRLADQGVVVDLQAVLALQLEDFALEILGHEIGHHVYAPANLGEHARLLARVRRGLPTREEQAPLVANLYTDLLINDRLQRGHGLRMDKIYQRINQGPAGRLWLLYMRIYEQLWRLGKGTLALGDLDDRLNGDAYLGARLVRAYARDWMEGAGGFAMLCLPYILEDAAGGQPAGAWLDTREAGQGAQDIPPGLSELDPGELSDPRHPAQDPRLGGEDRQPPQEPPAEKGPGQSGGQAREPFQYGELLRAMGMRMDDHEVALRYYRERALPHLVRFPHKLAPQATDPLPEGSEPWDPGSPLEDLDWLESLLVSPRVIPGSTTVQRVWGVEEGGQPRKEPFDLDLYVDSSGSMPNPQQRVSYLTLAGTILALSALRAGARVQATLWSGARQFLTTPGFTRNETAILRVLTGYFGGGTAFPLHVLRDTYAQRPSGARPAHLLVISDEGVDTMFEPDELGQPGREVVQAALNAAGGGGTLVLNLYQEPQNYPALAEAAGMGWAVFRVTDWEQLVAFAREFSRKQYG